MPSLETLFSFVNRWECDENDHLNVQFYYSRFDEADRQFKLLSGLNDNLIGSRRVRHVRYHKELRDAQLIKVRSCVAFDGPHMLTVVHEMYDPSTSVVAATAIDGYEPNSSSAKTLRSRLTDCSASMPEIAVPRGLVASPFTGRPTPAALASAGAAICFRGTVLPRHIGPEGRADDQFALSCFTDGVVHVWERTPMTHTYLTTHGYGRVAVEMKLSWASPLKTGEPVVVVTGFTNVNAKTFSFRHHMFEARTNRLAATLDVVGLVMNLKTRKAVPLPQDAVKTIARGALDRT